MMQLEVMVSDSSRTAYAAMWWLLSVFLLRLVQWSILWRLSALLVGRVALAVGRGWGTNHQQDNAAYVVFCTLRLHSGVG